MAYGTRVVLTIGGKQQYLWRAVTQDGNVLDMRVAEPTQQTSRQEILRAPLFKGLKYVPRVIVTDKLASYGAAKREILASVEHRQHKRLNNRAENSHQPTRLPERENAEIQISRSCATLSFQIWSNL